MTQSITSQLTPEQKSAFSHLVNLRLAIAKFHAARLVTDELLSGLRISKDATGMIKHPSTLVPIVRDGRDATAERNAVAQLRDLLHLIYQREPTVDEMRLAIPPPESLGIWWVPVAGISAIIGGAYSLSSLFSYLTEREQRIQVQLGVSPRSTWADVAHDWAPTIVPAAVVVIAGVGGWMLWSRYKKAKSESEHEVEDKIDDKTETEIEDEIESKT